MAAGWSANGSLDLNNWRNRPDVTIYNLRMCGRVIQSSGPLRFALVDGLDIRDSRLSNYPRRWNGAPSQELLVIRQNHKTGERSLDRGGA